MLWINFLHLYQPANSDNYIISEALHKSYYRLLRLLEENSNLKLTFNISGCLIERLAEMNELDFIDRLKAMVNSGRLELVGSASYHAFLPLIPIEESVRQIKENEEILRRYFGDNLKIKGFFFPEMAFNVDLLKTVKSLGYEWVILDEISAENNANLDLNRPFYHKESALQVVFRNRQFSRAYPPDEIIKILSAQSRPGNDRVIISATDGELYGLRHEDPTAELEGIASDKTVKTETISNFINSFVEPDITETELRESSWESEERDILNGEPFVLWLKKRNKIHRDLWALTKFVWQIGEKNSGDENYEWFRWHLKRGMASCTYWWASAHDFSADFGPYTWNPDMVERGAGDIIRSVRSLANPNSKKDKLQAEKYYLKLKKDLWREHWRKHWPQKK